MAPRIGICSWSLQPADARDLAAKLSQTGASGVQLALDPLVAGEWPIDDCVKQLADAGITILSGMMRTKGEDYSTLDTIRRTGGVRADEHWEANLATAARCAALSRQLRIPLVSFHAGFLPPQKTDPLRSIMLERLRQIVSVFAGAGVRTAFETGQETADTLLACLHELDRPGAGVTFDPANMILYDHGDPIEALRRLAPFVQQIHIKDAQRTARPGTWGNEVPVGQGDVSWPEFFETYHEKKIGCDLIIEREAGGRRLEEISAAVHLVRQYMR
jgi:sugar phosphate isomerase/epimerase